MGEPVLFDHAPIKVNDWVEVTFMSRKKARGVVLKIVMSGSRSTDRFQIEPQDKDGESRRRKRRWCYGHMLQKIVEPVRCRHCGKADPV